MRNWPTLELKGERFNIPRVCPNCLASGCTSEYLNAYQVYGTVYSMGFFYCDVCSALIEAVSAFERKQDRLRFLLTLTPALALFGWMFLYFGVILSRNGVPAEDEAAALQACMVVVPPTAAAWVAGLVWLRRRLRRSYPELPPAGRGRRVRRVLRRPDARRHALHGRPPGVARSACSRQSLMGRTPSTI